MANDTKDLMNGQAALAMDDALEGARRATGNASSIAPPDPEVVATARRRQFSSADRLRILTLADHCTKTGEIGALLRREGIYSSLLATWRKRRASIERAALEPQKRGRKAPTRRWPKRGGWSSSRGKTTACVANSPRPTPSSMSKKKFVCCWGS
jgi:transposase